jgi:hypothetical protein
MGVLIDTVKISLEGAFHGRSLGNERVVMGKVVVVSSC